MRLKEEVTTRCKWLYKGKVTQIQDEWRNRISSVPPGNTGVWKVVKVALKTVGHLHFGFQGHLLHQDSKGHLVSSIYKERAWSLKHTWESPRERRAGWKFTCKGIYSSLLISKSRKWVLNALHQGAGWADSNIHNRWTDSRGIQWPTWLYIDLGGGGAAWHTVRSEKCVGELCQ